MSILCKCLYDNKTTIVVWLSNGQFTYHICIFPFHASSSSFNAVLYLLPPWHHVKVAKKAKDTILSSPPSLTKHSRTWFHWGAEGKQAFEYGDDRSEVKPQREIFGRHQWRTYMADIICPRQIPHLVFVRCLYILPPWWTRVRHILFAIDVDQTSLLGFSLQGPKLISLLC